MTGASDEASKRPGRTTVVYVCGSQRGGTTVLGWLLGGIEGFAFGGELRNLWVRGLGRGRACGCGLPHRECQVWSRVLDDDLTFRGMNHREAAALQERTVPNRHSWKKARRVLRSRGATAGSPDARYADLVADVYAAFADATGARVVVDSSKNPAEAALLSFHPAVELYLVHIVRDPRGMVFSRHKRDRRGEVTRPHPWSTAYGSVHWMSRHLSTEAVRRALGGRRSLLVRYEDYVRDPRAVLSRVAALVGLEGAALPLAADGSGTLPTGHPPAGDGKFRERPIALRQDDRWIHELPPADRVLATSLTLPVLHRYGYAARVERARRSR